MQGVSHEVPPVAVGQDSGDVPVPGGQRLQDVCAGVGLRVGSNIGLSSARGESCEFNAMEDPHPYPLPCVSAHHGGRH